MFKPKKPSTPAEPSSGPSRLRLPTEGGLRPISGIRELLKEAKEKRGCTIELPWTTKKASQRFILTVRWDLSTTDAIWSLYEENEVESRALWSQPWSPSDLELMYDMIAMATDPDGSSKAQIPEDLKPGQEEPPPKEETKPATKNGAELAETTLSPGAQPAMPPYPPPYPYGYPAPMPYPMPYPAPQGYPAGAPPGYPPQVPPQAYPPQVPPPGYPQSVNTTGSWQTPFGTGAPQAGGAPASASPPIAPSINPAVERQAAMPIDMDLLQKRPNVLLGALLTRAELITEPTLEAALKVQDLVRAGRISTNRAPEILKLFFSMGASIEDYIDPSDFLTGKGAKADAAKKAPAVDLKELRQAFDLLIKSGLLTEDDIKTSNEVREKHGGDIRNILQAAGKVDSKTMSAAMICASLVKASSMKVEQCIIALNYCSRSRVGFDEALEELRWENPRKSGKKA
jgi:hypothetical protein